MGGQPPLEQLPDRTTYERQTYRFAPDVLETDCGGPAIR